MGDLPHGARMQTFKFDLSEREYRIVLGAIVEVIGAIHADELPLRVGASVNEIGAVFDKVRSQGEQQGATW